MSRFRNPMLICALLILASGYPLPRVRAAQPGLELAGRPVSMELVKAEDLSPASWPPEQVRLVTEAVVAAPGDTIFQLLEQRGIRPDPEALTIVYDLNPRLEKAEPLARNVRLTLPRVAGGPLLRRMFQSGHLVMLVVDKQIKAQFADNVRAIQSMSTCFADLDASRFDNANQRDATVSALKDLTAWLGHIRRTFAQRTAKPLRRVTLLQIHDEADVLRSIVEAALAPGAKLSAADQTQISLIHADITQAIERWDQTMAGELPPSEPQYKVEVEIVGPNPDMVRNLRVYYVPSGLFRNPPTNPPVRSGNFNGLGQQSSGSLPVKDYKVWAALDGSPMNPVTPPTDLKVRRPTNGETIRLTLSLKP